jgi:predicted RNase H-like nuclease
MSEDQDKAVIVGVDLAWGYKMPDGWCVLEHTPKKTSVLYSGLSQGDKDFYNTVDEIEDRHPRENLFWFLDAPVVVPNMVGSRPVDKLSHSKFGRFHAGMHPANRSRLSRPLEISKLLQDRGYAPGSQLFEVYPHLSHVHWFPISRVLKYKKPPRQRQLLEFRSYQHWTTHKLKQEFLLEEAWNQRELQCALTGAWTKNREDQLDALTCALTGLDWINKRAQMLGDLETGFVIHPLWQPRDSQSLGALARGEDDPAPDEKSLPSADHWKPTQAPPNPEQQ